MRRLLLQLFHVAWSVCMYVCLSSVCVEELGAWESCAKMAEPIEMLFWGRGLSRVGPRNHVLDGGQDQTNPFAAMRGDKSAMWPFAKLLWTHVSFVNALNCCDIHIASLFDWVEIKNKLWPISNIFNAGFKLSVSYYWPAYT